MAMNRAHIFTSDQNFRHDREEFTGIGYTFPTMIAVTRTLSIDDDELEFHFIRASGPGGQNVNKVASAVQLRFDVRRSRSLPNDVAIRLMRLAGSRLTKDGVLVLIAQNNRTQERNREDARERLFDLIRQAAVKPTPRRPTKVPKAQRRERLEAKRHRSGIKSQRRAGPARVGRFATQDADRVARLERAAAIPPIVAQLLLGRGVYEPDAARTFLDCKLTGLRDPDELPGCDAAADRLYAAVREKKKIVVYGDYDADGMTGTSLLLSCLRLLGAEASFYVPNRLEEGYGLNHEALRGIAQRGGQTVVSVDCGIASVEEADTAKQLGIELIITDHHEFAERLPDAAAIVHPRLPGSSYPFGGLCGAGVALKLAWALCQRASQSKKVTDAMRDFLLSAVGLAALGTVADLVPLTGENRILVRYGLEVLSRTRNAGLRALMARTGLAGTRPTAWQIGFVLAPRINAVGRMDAAEKAVGLLLTDDAAEAEAIAEEFEGVNTTRQEEDRRLLAEVLAMVEAGYDPERDRAIVMAGEGWHPGVIGIVASRLVERYGKPAIVLAVEPDGRAKGSGRSIEGFDLLAALDACAAHLERYGGHRAAAGVELQAAAVDAFREAFVAHAGTVDPSTEPREAELVDAFVEPLVGAARVRERLTETRCEPRGLVEPLGDPVSLRVSHRDHVPSRGRSVASSCTRVAPLTAPFRCRLAGRPLWRRVGRARRRLRGRCVLPGRR